MNSHLLNADELLYDRHCTLGILFFLQVLCMFLVQYTIMLLDFFAQPVKRCMSVCQCVNQVCGVNYIGCT